MIVHLAFIDGYLLGVYKTDQQAITRLKREKKLIGNLQRHLYVAKRKVIDDRKTK